MLISQRKIHKMVQSENWGERREAANLLGSNFEVLSDKEEAWNDLHRLTLDKVPDVRMDAVHSLGIAFPNIPNKKKAWKDIHRLTQVKEEYVREYAALALGYAFSHIPDKEQAWNDLKRLAQDEEPEVLESAAMSLNAAFPDISNKEQAWEHLVRLARYNDYDVLSAAIDGLGEVYSDILDKEQAWKDIFWLTQDGEKDFGRWRAVYALGAAFPHNPNKQWAWEDIHQLTQYDDKDIRQGSAHVLGTMFPHIPDKEQAWLDLHRLTLDEVNYVRKNAVLALGFAFLHIPDKEQACSDLHRLIEDSDEYVRYSAAIALGSVFSHLSDKEPAWKDLARLVQDKTGYVQSAAVISLGIVFPHVPDKKQAWEILHAMTRDVRHDSAIALGLAFSHIPDKEQACRDLIWLAQDKDKKVRGSANYSLGKASIFKATEAKSEEEFRKELEKALEFFEKSSKDATYGNPAIFCLPFYRTFYTITFKKQNAVIELHKYLAEAKIASDGSESREKLLEAVENLSNALKEALKARDFSDLKFDLKAYRRYCERACELLDTTEEKAPGASRLIRKGLPIIDEKIKEIIAEIQEKAKVLCKQVKDTEFKEIGQQANIIGQELSKVIDPIRLDKEVSRILIPLSAMCKKMPEEDRGEACEILKQINDEQNVEDKLPLISMFLSKISTQMNQKNEQNMPINIKISGTQSRVNIDSVDKSTNFISGNLQTDLENLKTLIESDYNKADKSELVQAVDRMTKTCTDSPKKNTLKEKLGWLLTKTSEVSSISSLVITLLQTYTGT